MTENRGRDGGWVWARGSAGLELALGGGCESGRPTAAGDLVE